MKKLFLILFLTLFSINVFSQGNTSIKRKNIYTNFFNKLDSASIKFNDPITLPDNYLIANKSDLNISYADTISYSAFKDSMENNKLTPNKYYLITDRTVSLNGKGQGAGTSGNILLKAIDSSGYDKNCLLIGLNPDHPNRQLWKSYQPDDTVLWDGYTWKFDSGSKSSEPGSNSDWIKIDNEVPFINNIKYRVSDDFIYYRSDGSNKIGFDPNKWWDYHASALDIGGYSEYNLNNRNPIDLFCWENSWMVGNIVVNGVIDNQNSGEYCAVYSNNLLQSVIHYYSPDTNTNDFAIIASNNMLNAGINIDTFYTATPSNEINIAGNFMQYSSFLAKKFINSNEISLHSCCHGFSGMFMMNYSRFGSKDFDIVNLRAMDSKFNRASVLTTEDINYVYFNNNIFNSFTGFLYSENITSSSTFQHTTDLYHAGNAGALYMNENRRYAFSNAEMSNLDTTLNILSNELDIKGYALIKFGIFNLSSLENDRDTIENFLNFTQRIKKFKIIPPAGDTLIIDISTLYKPLILIGNESYAEFINEDSKLKLVSTSLVPHNEIENSVHPYTDTENTWTRNQNFDSITYSKFYEVSTEYPKISAGFRTMNVYTDNKDGTITISNDTIILYSNANFKGEARTYILTGGTTGTDFSSLTDNTTNYIVGKYNNGSPVYDVITDVSLINESDVLPYLTIYRYGDSIEVLDWDRMSLGLPNKLHQRMVKTDRFARESGLSLSESATRVVNISAGVFWNGASKQSCDIFSSSTDRWDFWYYNGSAWVYTNTTTQYNNTQYNDATGLVGLSNNKYTVNWIYRMLCEDKHAAYILGNVEYDDLGEASVAQPRSDLPKLFSSNAVLVGRIIVEKDATTADVINSSFETVFTTSAVTDHNNLTTLQGGTTDEYYHHTSAEYNTNHPYLNTENTWSKKQTLQDTLFLSSGDTVASRKQFLGDDSSFFQRKVSTLGGYGYSALMTKEPTLDFFTGKYHLLTQVDPDSIADDIDDFLANQKYSMSAGWNLTTAYKTGVIQHDCYRGEHWVDLNDHGAIYDGVRFNVYAMSKPSPGNAEENYPNFWGGGGFSFEVRDSGDYFLKDTDREDNLKAVHTMWLNYGNWSGRIAELDADGFFGSVSLGLYDTTKIIKSDPVDTNYNCFRLDAVQVFKIWREQDSIHYSLPNQTNYHVFDSTLIAKDDLIVLNELKANSDSTNYSIHTNQSLSDAATITWNVSNGCIGNVTLTANRLLSISNAVAGMTGTLIVTQDATGNHTLTFSGGTHKVANGGSGSVTLTSNANAIDILTFFYDGTTFYWNISNNYN